MLIRSTVCADQIHCADQINCADQIHWAAGLQGCCAAGLLAAGLLGYWAAGLQGCWPAGLLGCWAAGCWPAGLLGCWAAGLLSSCRRVVKVILALVSQRAACATRDDEYRLMARVTISVEARDMQAQRMQGRCICAVYAGTLPRRSVCRDVALTQLYVVCVCVCALHCICIALHCMTLRYVTLR